MVQPRITRWRQNFPIMVVSSCHMLSRSQATNGEQGHFPALSVTSLLASRQCEGRNCPIQRQTVQETDLRPFCGEPAGWTGSRSMWGEKWDLQRGQKPRIGRTGILFWSHQRKWQLAETEDPEEYWGCRLKRWMQDGGNKLLKKLRHKKRKLIEKLLWKGEMFWECSPRKDTGPRNQWMWVAFASGQSEQSRMRESQDKESGGSSEYLGKEMWNKGLARLGVWIQGLVFNECWGTKQIRQQLQQNKM